LDNYPSASPQTILYGNIAHCHVYNTMLGRYKICFSLDRSFESYFKSTPTSMFNPSLSLIYYVVNVYKYIAEDDRLHSISGDRLTSCYKYWSTYKPPTHFSSPDVILDYEEACYLHNVQLYTDSNDIEYVDFRDYVDGKSLLINIKPYVYPIAINHVNRKYRLRLINTDILKYEYFEMGIRKASDGTEFTNCMPAIINSAHWNFDIFMSILDSQIAVMYNYPSDCKIFSTDDLSQDDYYIYTIFELFSQISNEIFRNNKVTLHHIQQFNAIHHLLLYLLKYIPSIKERIIQHLTYFLEYDDIMDTKLCKNINIITGMYLIKECDWVILIKNIMVRCIDRAINDIYLAKKLIKYENNRFINTNELAWANFVWEHNYSNFQRLAVQKLYNDIFKDITLDQYDEISGTFNKHLLNDFYNKVKTIYSWKNYCNFKGFTEFCKFMNVDINIANLINISLDKYILVADIDHIKKKWTNPYYHYYFNYTYHDSPYYIL